MAARMLSRFLATLALLGLPLLSWAHEGHDAGMHHGMGLGVDATHPIFDIDHLLVLVAIGIVAALIYKARR